LGRLKTALFAEFYVDLFLSTGLAPQRIFKRLGTSFKLTHQVWLGTQAQKNGPRCSTLGHFQWSSEALAFDLDVVFLDDIGK
jgi:hypothetical protein